MSKIIIGVDTSSEETIDWPNILIELEKLTLHDLINFNLAIGCAMQQLMEETKQ